MLRAEAAALTSYLHDHPAAPPQRVADMLFRTRLPRRYRALSMVTGHHDLFDALRAIVDGRTHPAVVRSDGPAAARRVAYVLPGQGSQRPGMGALFYHRVPAYRAEAERCDRVFRELFDESALDYLLGTTETGDTTVVQSALFMQMTSLGAMWRSFGVDADVAVGHSQGEIAAAYLAGKMTLEDAAFVLGTRARAAETIASDAYAMAVAATDRDECEAVLARQAGWAQVSVVNSPHMVGISGERDTVQAAVDTLTGRGVFTRVIPVSYPAHTNAVSRLHDEVVGAVRGGLHHSEFLDSSIELIGATLGDWVTSDVAVADYWFWNLRNTVRFDRAIAAAVTRGADVFVELAEHPTLQLAIEENLGALLAQAAVVGTSERDAQDLTEFTRNLATLAVGDIDYRWDALRTESNAAMTLPLLDFPNTQMNELPLWLPHDGFAAPQAAPAPRAQRVPDVRAQVLVEQWQVLGRRSVVAPRSLGIVDHTGACVDLAAALQAHAEQQELSARLITDLADAEGVDSLVVLQPAYERLSADAAVAPVCEFFAGRSWWFPPHAGLKDYWLVTVGGEHVRADDGPPDPVGAALAAGFRCIGGEYPDIAFRHLDLPASADASAIVAALHTADEPELAMRDGSLYAKRIAELAPTPADIPLTGRHVLITGGTGAVGMEFAEYTARAGAGRITLVSRSGSSAVIAERLRRLPKPVDVQAIACDVTDADAVARLAGDLRDNPVDLLVHAVMDTDGTGDTDLAGLSVEQITRGLRGKAVGLSRVLEVLPLSGEARILLCSSMAAVLGGRGKIVYAAANRLLDASAQLLRAEGRDCVSVQWGQWAVFEGRDHAELANLAEIGYRAMSSDAAIELGLSRLPATAAVAAFDVDRARSAFGLLGYGPTLSVLAEPAEQAAAHDVSGTRERLLQMFAEVIGIDDPQALDSTEPLVAVGLDSLNALQLRRRIKTEFRCEVAVSELLGGATLDDVMGWVAAGVDPATVVPAEPARAVTATQAELDLDGIPSARADLDLFGLAAVWRMLDPVLGDGDVHGTAEIADRLKIAQRHRWILRQWLHELVTRGHVGREADGYRRLRPPSAPTRPDLVSVCTDLGYPRLFGEFLTAANERLSDLVADRLSVQELLFPDGSTATADAFYRDNVISRHLNQRVREAVSGHVRRLMGELSPVRILELGAGVGGMTNEIVSGLTGLPVEYHFTDVSSFFLNAAQQRFADRPWMTFGIVDLNTDLGQQPPCDIVVAANVVHNAQDIGRALGNIHGILRPGGAVFLIELCTAHCCLMTSVYFLMSPRAGQPQVGLTDVRAGTDRILLTRDEWRSEFARAGFTPMPTVPAANDPLAPLDQYLLGAVRKP
ncbi:methyltransferase [Mycobacterium sp. SWH-M3]|nr:methyltransferase [Mycobacterium sp. SWH-M3]